MWSINSFPLLHRFTIWGLIIWKCTQSIHGFKCDFGYTETGIINSQKIHNLLKKNLSCQKMAKVKLSLQIINPYQVLIYFPIVKDHNTCIHDFMTSVLS